MSDKPYILVVDDEEMLRELYTTIVEALRPEEIVQAASGNAAIGIMGERGAPAAVISDYRMPDGDGAKLGSFCTQNFPATPFLLCSGSPEDEMRAAVPNAYAYVQKPSVFAPLQKALASCLPAKAAENQSAAVLAPAPAFVAFRISLFVRVALLRYDVYLRLGAEKFIKIGNRGDMFRPEDAAKLLKKRVSQVYLKGGDVAHFLADLQAAVHMVKPADADAASMGEVGFEIIEATYALARELGWDDSVVQLAQRGAEMALRAVAGEKDLARLLNARLKNPESRYGEHVASLILLTSYLAESMGWASDFTLSKLSLAALLHDASLHESSYEPEAGLLARAADPRIEDPEVNRFREHPLQSAQLVRKFTSLPPDLDQIILQHHESPSGTGYPAKLSAVRIAPLAALFIMSEDLANYVAGSAAPAEAIDAFFRERSEVYGQGNFRKIFAALAIAQSRAA